jgi:SAM-dependent methyltransferase
MHDPAPDPYARVAEYYDIMVDWPARLARERDFFAGVWAERPVRRVLDVGCGTGHHARLFTDLGAEVVAIDPSGPMLARARALTAGGNPTFLDGGFELIPSLPGTFDLITVLGNTLAYAHDEFVLRDILSAMRGKLAPGGRVLAQGVNYDSLIAAGSRWLPLVARRADDADYLFLREYRMLGDRAEFTLITLLGPAWTQLTERSTHLPITEGLLPRAARDAGLRVTLYGDYARAPYAWKTSPNLIAVCEVGT